MKTYQQFNEGLGTVAKVAIKGAAKLAKKGGLKKVGKLLKKKPRRTIDPFFADKAVERGTMVRGFHGQSAKNISQYKKTGVPPAVSGLNPSTSGYNKATQDWMKRTGYKPKTNRQDLVKMLILQLLPKQVENKQVSMQEEVLTMKMKNLRIS